MPPDMLHEISKTGAKTDILKMYAANLLIKAQPNNTETDMRALETKAIVKAIVLSAI